MERVVRPEILDELPSDDPRAIRSRRDLRWINTVLGNERWVEKQFLLAGGARVVELGAGEGKLSERLSKHASVIAVDLAPRPVNLSESINWLQGDLFKLANDLDGDVLVASLFLHHFETGDLVKLAERLLTFETLIFCEPWRVSWGHKFGSLWRPLMNDVTWHDMHVSIDAGFIPGELPRIFGGSWEWTETTDWRGSIRTVGRRRS